MSRVTARCSASVAVELDGCGLREDRRVFAHPAIASQSRHRLPASCSMGSAVVGSTTPPKIATAAGDSFGTSEAWSSCERALATSVSASVCGPMEDSRSGSRRAPHCGAGGSRGVVVPKAHVERAVEHDAIVAPSR
jgi:hypothetical protein